jgi:hypothetical protein
MLQLVAQASLQQVGRYVWSLGGDMGSDEVSVHVEQGLCDGRPSTRRIGSESELGSSEEHRLPDLGQHGAETIACILDFLIGNIAAGEDTDLVRGRYPLVACHPTLPASVGASLSTLEWH